MKRSQDSFDGLERLVGATLRSQPPMRAPRTLEQRVLAELQRRAGLPWWRASFHAWPQPARAVLLLICFACGWILVKSPAAAVAEALRSAVVWLTTAANVVSSVASVAAYVIDSIPPLWLYAVAAVTVAVYVAFFGLGAAAYRTLYK